MNPAIQLNDIDLSFLPETPQGRAWVLDESPRYSKSAFDLILTNTETGRPAFWCCIGFVDDNGEHHYVTEVKGITEEILLDCAEQTMRMLDLQF